MGITSTPLSPTESKVRGIIAEQLGFLDEEIRPTLELRADLDADSLDIIEIIMSLEEDLGITISDSEQERLETDDNIAVRDIYALVASKLETV